MSLASNYQGGSGAVAQLDAIHDEENALQAATQSALSDIASDFDSFMDFFCSAEPHAQVGMGPDALSALVRKERTERNEKSVAFMRALRACYLRYINGQPHIADDAAQTIGSSLSYFAQQYAADQAERAMEKR